MSKLRREDKEGKMAKYDAKEIAQDAVDIFKMIDETTDLPEWLEAKITKAADYMNSVKDYLTHHMKEGFGGDLKGSDKKKFEKARKGNGEQLGYKLTGTSDIKEIIKLKSLIKVKK